MNSGFDMNKSEIETLKSRATEAVACMVSAGTLAEGLINYAVENGFSSDEARILVENKVIPLVEKYNCDCRTHVDDESNEWVCEQISARVEGMTLEEECKYKIGLLSAFRAAATNTLKSISDEQNNDFKKTAAFLTDEESEYFDEGAFSEEMLVEINEKLTEAIDSIGLEIEMTGKLESLLESNVSPDDVQGFVTELWEDEQYKYALCTAICVARKNGELPSASESLSDEALVIGICQGIDAANVEKKVSADEMTVDRAYEILRTVATVGVAIISASGIFVGGLLLAEATFISLAGALGNSMVGTIVAAAIGGSVFCVLESDFFERVGNAADIFHKVSDFTYNKFKQGIKIVSKVLKERIVPKIRQTVENIGEFFQFCAYVIKRRIQNNKLSNKT